MIKIHTEEIQASESYPRLKVRRYDGNDSIVALFSKPKTGVILIDSSGSFDIGRECSLSEEHYEDYDRKLVLQNA